ncbi:hypothetical protein E3U55_13965 [Filobacillus milosensis]|uniref:Transglutaminase-like domain-containing protein n=1 Tax=Filobacillus milosensis TaxID=94137 RepID=A0A4Y8IGX9_9BACI|nr:DUF4129 domain-containing transglutaminase family protein [Filobacillus milosensis]TFB14281.1 hypothetical protein E3U55_13965 [Filobacillus milosensis]
MQDLSQENKMISLVLYFGSMILLLEWIYPLGEVTDTGNMSVFFLYIVLCFILTASYLPVWVVSPVKFLGLLFVMDRLFYMAIPFISKDWFVQLFTDIKMNISMVISQNWLELTPSFRTILFLILLWMMSYLLYYWFAVRKKPFSFVLLTFIYLTVLDTFTVFDGSTAIIRAFIIGVAILGISYLQHILEKENVRTPVMTTLVKWVAPLVLVIGFSTVIGYAAPKFDPIWPDPVPFIQSAAENGFGDGPGNRVQKIGYGENDERLGGGFVQDDTRVFWVQAPKSQYWKVETKDTYTGKGWVRSDEGSFSESMGSIGAVGSYSELVETNEDEANIRFDNPGVLNKLTYAYGSNQVIPEASNMTFLVNSLTGEVIPRVDSEAKLPDAYQLNINRPFFPIDELRKIGENVLTQEDQAYLQLPESLPDRVIRLAEEITAEADNRYDKAKAIENYFSKNGFIYDTQNVAVPGEDEDYVDQFLFETQKGYCDNFSTSMVVMLRAVDIPARWAKGFTGGERVYNQDVFQGSQPEYEITNNNAHSWVEVYFPNVGWVPFEPTVGFSNPSNFVYGESIDDILEQEQQDLEMPEPQQPELPEDEQADEDDNGATGGIFSLSNPMKYTILGVGVLAIGLIVWLISRNRYNILGRWKRQRMARRKDVDTFTDGYQFILKVLAKNGLELKGGQTLREYASDVDRWYGGSDMSELTSYYERAIYRDESIENQHHEVYRLWNRLVNNLLS